jgi:beta-glucosidase/6-phospho-beta-glucosidase/beta-galactosidase
MHIHLGAFESTHIFGAGRDILGTTRHIELWESDLNRLLTQGITMLRYSAPWHRIEAHPGTYDWSWFDGPMEFMRANNMVPILDPLHHTSFPSWLKDGFLNPRFPELYTCFLRHLCARYPWAHHYTIFNEPLPTTLFCSYTGMWYPHLASHRTFVRMLLQVGRAICLGCECVKKLIPARFIHVDTCEHHNAIDRRSSAWTRFANARRFLVTDLVLGLIGRDHELYSYLTRNGASDADLAWFARHPARIDVLGLDYYAHSEMDWAWSPEKRRPDITPVLSESRGFAAIANEYVARYGLPVMLSETNLVGTIHERISWLKLMEAECEELASSGIDFRGFCWYPSIDTTDWSNACTRCTGVIDRQGIWSLAEGTMDRIGTELSGIYGALARGKITAAQIPDYGFGPDLAHRLRAYRQEPRPVAKIA